jgi:hypothetical protein
MADHVGMSSDWTGLGIVVEFKLSHCKYSIKLCAGQAAAAVNVWVYCSKDLLIPYLFCLPGLYLHRDFTSTILYAYIASI